MRDYVTNFTRGAYHQWTCSKAVAELVSNWLDSDGEREYDLSSGTLTLTNKNIKVSNKMLLAGASDKRDDETKRGQFGLGSVQALVVLTDLGYKVNIENSDVLWKPEFVYCDKFEAEVLTVKEELSHKNKHNFTVIVEGLNDEDIEEIKARCLVFQDRPALFSTEFGDIICNEDGEGEVYCGDMFVCQNNGFEFSYNFKPKVVPLNSDRSAVDNWELKKLTAKMIVATEDDDFILKCIKSDTLDTQLVNSVWGDYKTSDTLNERLAQEFIADNGNAIVCDDYSEHKEHEKLGNKSVYIENESIARAIMNSDLYTQMKDNLVVIEKKSPDEIVHECVDEVLEILWEHDIIPIDKIEEEDQGDMTKVKHLLYKLKEESFKWQH